MLAASQRPNGGPGSRFDEAATFKPTFRQMQVRYDQLCGVANTILCFVGNMGRTSSIRRVAAAAKGRGAYTHQRIEADSVLIRHWQLSA